MLLDVGVAVSSFEDLAVGVRTKMLIGVAAPTVAWLPVAASSARKGFSLVRAVARLASDAGGELLGRVDGRLEEAARASEDRLAAWPPGLAKYYTFACIPVDLSTVDFSVPDRRWVVIKAEMMSRDGGETRSGCYHPPGGKPAPAAGWLAPGRPAPAHARERRLADGRRDGAVRQVRFGPVVDGHHRSRRGHRGEDGLGDYVAECEGAGTLHDALVCPGAECTATGTPLTGTRSATRSTPRAAAGFRPPRASLQRSSHRYWATSRARRSPASRTPIIGSTAGLTGVWTAFERWSWRPAVVQASTAGPANAGSDCSETAWPTGLRAPNDPTSWWDCPAPTRTPSRFRSCRASVTSHGCAPARRPLRPARPTCMRACAGPMRRLVRGRFRVVVPERQWPGRGLRMRDRLEGEGRVPDSTQGYAPVGLRPPAQLQRRGDQEVGLDYGRLVRRRDRRARQARVLRRRVRLRR